MDLVAVAEVDLRIRPEPHVFDPGDRARIEAGWAAVSARNPRLWNGPFFLFDWADFRRAEGGYRFVGEGASTDFASFLAWRDRTPLDPRFSHVFPVGAVVTADDRLMIGRMGAHTANPGRLYPPSGSFEPSDLMIDGDTARLDPVANMVREIAEEVGLDARSWPLDPGWLIVESGPRRHAVVRVIRAPDTAADLAARAEAFIARDAEPELDGVLFPRIGDRVDPVLSVPYVNRLLAHLAGLGASG